MIDPADLQRARLALAQIDEAWRLLATTRDATLAKARPSPRAMGARAAAELDELLREERVDRLQGFRQRLVPLPATPTPVRLGVLDAEAEALDAMLALAWRTAERIGGRWMQGRGWWTWPPARHVTVLAAARYLRGAVDHGDPAHAAWLGRRLRPVAERLQAAAGLDEHWTPLPGGRRCPACGKRSLRAYVSGPDPAAWTIVCASRPACRCAGESCRCGRPGRQADSEHIWAQDDVVRFAPPALVLTPVRLP